MAKPDNRYDELAAEAAARVERSRAAGRQLPLLPDEPGEGAGGPGTGRRGKAKAVNRLRDWLAHRGFKMPEDVLAEMAGLSSRDDAVTTALATMERIVLAAETGAPEYRKMMDGRVVRVSGPSAAQRAALFIQIYTIQLRAAEALAPYGLAKLTPDVAVTSAVTIVMPGGAAPAVPGAGARDVTPQARRIAPPPMPDEIQRNQGLADAVKEHSDAEIRTEGIRR